MSNITEIDLCFIRGDTAPFDVNVQDENAAAIDITGFSFLLTVDPSPAPDDALANLFQLTGTITDGPGGVVQFQLTPVQADQPPSVYFYDVQMTDTGGSIRTILRGQWEVQQDITK